MAAFGNRLKKARERREISQIELAEALSVSQGTISQWERNIRRPDDEQIKRLKKKLGDALKVKVPSAGGQTKKANKAAPDSRREPTKAPSTKNRKQPSAGAAPVTAKTRNGKTKNNMANNGNGEKSLESWIWDAACSIRGAQDAPKYKDFILPLIFTKRLCDVFDNELNRIAEKVGSREKAFKLVERDKKLVRFFLPLKPANPEDPVWSMIRKLADKIGEALTTILREIAGENPPLEGIIDRVDFNATTHGQRDIEDDRLSNLIEKITEKRLGLKDVEADIIGRSYEYLIRKFAEGGGQSAGEFYTPAEVGMVMARIMDPEPGMNVYDPCCGSGGLLIKCELALEAKEGGFSNPPLGEHGRADIPVRRSSGGLENPPPVNTPPCSSSARSTSETPGPWPT